MNQVKREPDKEISKLLGMLQTIWNYKKKNTWKTTKSTKGRILENYQKY